MIKKVLIYTGFAVICLMVVVSFVTSNTPLELGTAVAMYPLPVFFAYQLFIKNSKNGKGSSPTTQDKNPINDSGSEGVILSSGDINVSDIDKRAFLKIIGAAGISLFFYSIFSKRSENLFLGKIAGPQTTSLEDASGKVINPAERQPTDSYVISEIDDDITAFYGFTNKDGGWYIMREERDGGSFRYVKGDNNFEGAWNGRKDLSYNYYHQVFS